MSGQIVAVSPKAAKPSGTASIRIQVQGINRLNRALSVIGEDDAPYLREALEQVGRMLAGEIRARGRPSIVARIEQGPIRGSGAGIRLPMAVVHPAAATLEFGRQWWYRGKGDGRIGNNRPGSKRRKGVFRRYGERIKYHPGMPARPYVGIVHGDQAIGAIQPETRRLIEEALEREWARIAAEGADDAA